MSTNSHHNKQFTENIQLFLLRSELIESGIYNENLHGIIRALKWRLSNQVRETNIERRLNSTILSNFTCKEEIYLRSKIREEKLKKNLEKSEFKLIELETTLKNSNLLGTREGAINRQQMKRRSSARMSMKIGCGGNMLGRLSLKIGGDLQARRFSRMTNTSSNNLVNPGVLDNKLPSRLDGALPIIPENEGESENRIPNTNLVNETRTESIRDAMITHELDNLKDNLGELKEENRLQRDRAEQMKNAYLNAREQIGELTALIQLTKREANSLLENETLKWQLNLKEIKVYIYIYINIIYI